jgi:hypothetical protein
MSSWYATWLKSTMGAMKSAFLGKKDMLLGGLCVPQHHQSIHGNGRRQGGINATA